MGLNWAARRSADNNNVRWSNKRIRQCRGAFDWTPLAADSLHGYSVLLVWLRAWPFTAVLPTSAVLQRLLTAKLRLSALSYIKCSCPKPAFGGLSGSRKPQCSRSLRLCLLCFALQGGAAHAFIRRGALRKQTRTRTLRTTATSTVAHQRCAARDSLSRARHCRRPSESSQYSQCTAVSGLHIRSVRPRTVPCSRCAAATVSRRRCTISGALKT